MPNPAALPASPAGPPDPRDLIAWYDRNHRRLPWRVSPADRARGVEADPYAIWLSEVMLQQTTVAAVKSYFEAFLARWPTVADLAAADEAEVMKAWAGLGYYSRARNLKACADAVAARHGGRFPDTEEGLRALPGIGAYTAAAVAAIAFDRKATVVDGNVERVVARVFAVTDPLPGVKPELKRLAATLTPERRAGDFAQAMMDLGATICTPKKPACGLCPWRGPCRARQEGIEARLPARAPKAARPTRRGVAYVAVRRDGAVLLRRRPPRGLLGGMTEVPTTAWTAREDGVAGPDSAPFGGAWSPVAATVEHTFTHFHLVLSVLRSDRDLWEKPPAGAWWSLPATLASEALPSVMKKAVEAALGRPIG
jgi:A/G-specific adenine glycosylase